MSGKSLLRIGVVCFLLIAVGIWSGLKFKTSRAKLNVALVGFYDSDASLLVKTGTELGVRVETFPRAKYFADPESMARFDAVVFRTMGFGAKHVTPETDARFDECRFFIPYPSQKGFFDQYAKFPGDVTQETVDGYLMTPTPHNANAFWNLMLREILGENVVVDQPEDLPKSGYFYSGTSVSPTYEEWLKREDVVKLPEDAPVVALVGMFLNPYKLSDSTLATVVETFADCGLRAVPIYGASGAPELIEQTRPNAIVDFPLGRLMSDDSAPKLFEKLDAPVFTAVNLSVPEKTWRAEPVGATVTYQNLAVALPELDGATQPTPISTLEEDADGMETRFPIQERIERLADCVKRTIELRNKPNSEKKVAIFYRRSPGASAITAQSLDAVPSMYNALNAMREAGYDLGDDFPATLEEFAEIVDKRGRTIGQWAPGAFRTFLEEGKPERVSTEDYLAWAQKDLTEQLRKETASVWGTAPGAYFTGQTEDGASFIAVSRIRFGNVVLLPQPTTAIVADDKEGSDFDSVHGTNQAPPYFYQAAYLWVREGFQADAIVHFGTHGSLEFTRGKSALMSENCWPDALIGDAPNIYPYSINNVGEALLAKRRIRATIVSHTTPPFVEAGSSDEFLALESSLDAFDAAQDDVIRKELAAEIETRAQECGLTPFDATERSHHACEHGIEETEDECRAEFYRDQILRIRETSVTDGLHVLGRPWTEEQIAATAVAIGTDDAEANLRESVGGRELERFIAALDGRFISPSTGGDPLVNADSLPTGRNMAGVNIEQTPDSATCRVAERLTNELIDDYVAKNGRYPRRIAFTLWGGEYIRTRGLSVAQALWAMGARPVFDKKGVIRDVEIVSAEELGRPRIDIVVQTSGQFRDAAASRIEFLDRVVRKIAELDDEAYPNYVKEHTKQTIALYAQKGYVEEESRELATIRVFGSPRSLDYGTGIRRLIERSDRWETRGQIADQYLLNMGGAYRSGKVWGVAIEGLLEANLQECDVVMQSRSSNTWGPVKLDHLYEFGTLAAVVREKTGVEPAFLLTDARRGGKARTQKLDEAIRDEMHTTFWNKRWLAGLVREKGGSGAATLAKATQNMFGWGAVGSEGLIDDATWQRTYETFVEDKLELGMREYFESTNPGALADTTAVMLDATRKEFWNATQDVVENLAKVHAENVQKFGPCCSYNVCGNPDLRDFIASKLSEADAAAYRAALDSAVRDSATDAEVSGVELVEKKDEPKQEETKKASPQADEEAAQEDAEFWTPKRLLALIATLIVALGFAGGLRSRNSSR